MRLGDIGEHQPYDSHVRRTSHKPWKHLTIDHRKDPNSSGKSSKTRPLTNLSSSATGFVDFSETLDDNNNEKDGNLDCVAIGSWKVKESKKRGTTGTKRVRSNWVTRIDGGEREENEKYGGVDGGGDEIDDGYRDFDKENSESPMKDQSPVNSMENLNIGNEHYHHGSRRLGRSYSNNNDGIEMSGPSDNDVRDWKCGERNGNVGGGGGGGEDGVRIWLNGLGLGRYAPVFEIHEVDDEVLPMLTLEDLKDMGINAVGSRRKMFAAIQKLGKGFS